MAGHGQWGFDMSEMVERVSRALFDLAVSDAVCDPEDWPALKVDFIEKARAAIAAMREPTHAMVLYGKDALGYDPDGPDDVLVRQAYMAMINVALK